MTVNLRTHVKRARGLGAAHHGLAHWWGLRITSVALVPLTAWLVVSIFGLIGEGYAGYQAWIGNPFNAGVMILLLVATFHHAASGMQEVYADYLHHRWTRRAADLGTRGVCALLAIWTSLSVLNAAFGG